MQDIDNAKKSESDSFRLRYISRPVWKRPAYIPTMFFLWLAWLAAFLLIFAGPLFLADHGNLQSGMAWRSIIAGMSLALVLGLYSAWYFYPFSKTFMLELNETGVRLVVFNRLLSQEFVSEMKFSQMSFIEFFSPKDTAALVFHAKNGKRLEVPIWPFEPSCQAEIKNFLQKEKVVKLIQI